MVMFGLSILLSFFIVGSAQAYYGTADVNGYTALLKRIFKWSVSHEKIPGTTYQALSTVEGLQAGRSDARDTEPVKPVPKSHIEAVLPFVSRQVGALIKLQLLTAARPGELLKLRPLELVSPRKFPVLRENTGNYR